MSARDTTETPHAERAALQLVAAPGAAALLGRLSPRRWRHTLSVAETAHRLAEAFGWPEAERDRVVRAALLHDIAKELPEDEARRLAAEPLPEARAADAAGRAAGDRKGAPDPDLGEGSTALLHAPAGARIAARDFGIRDVEVLRAIATHPTGTPDESDLARLLLVSDYLEPGRPRLNDEDRRLLASALAGALDLPRLHCRVLRRKLSGRLEAGRAIHPRSVAAWNAHCAGGG